jgi:hypothetical protein
LIADLDSSVLARTYLLDEDGHDEAVRLLADPQIVAVTGPWTRIEVSGALIRAGRSLAVPARAEPGEELGFFSRDQAQSTVALLLGFTQSQSTRRWDRARQRSLPPTRTSVGSQKLIHVSSPTNSPP